MRNCARKTKLSPSALLNKKETLAEFCHSLMLPIGPIVSGLPLAPWALLIGCLSLQMETNSKRFLLHGEG